MKARKVLDGFIYAIGGAYVLLFLFAAVLRLIYPYEVEWNEGAVLDHAIRVMSNKPIYAVPSLDFTAFVYTPLYYYMTAFVMKIGGVGLWAGRSISILSTLLTAAIAGRIVRRETSSSLLAFSSVALYLAFYHLTGFFYDIVRMDALAVSLVAASVYASLYFRRGYLIAAMLVALAYFTKQQMLFIIPSITIGMAFRNKKQALWFSVSSVALIVVGTLMLNLGTNGWYKFYTLTIPSIKAAQGFSWLTAMEFFPKWIFSAFGLFTLIVVVAIIMLGKKNLRNKWPILWAAYLMALVSSAISIGNFGGYQNVFMPLTLMIAIVFPLSIHAISDALPEWRVLAHGIILLAFLSLMYNPLGEKMLFASARQRRAGDAFIAKLKSMPGDVWIPFHGYIGTLADKPTHVHFMAMNDALVPHDSTSARFQHQIDSSLAAHAFSAIILDEESVYRWDSVQHYTRASEIFNIPNVFLSRIGEAGTRPDYIYLPAP
jgi:4-amino-4-deoxy-L-arabinose transferase-like glycosyltransferase